MNIVQITEQLKQLSDEQLDQVAKNDTAPGFALMIEKIRRSNIRERAPSQPTGDGTVYQNIMSDQPQQSFAEGSKGKPVMPSKDQILAWADAAADKYGIDRSVMRGLIHKESSFRPNAKGPLIEKFKGTRDQHAIGLTQLLPSTAEEMGYDENDPRQNVFGGAKYLSRLYKQFGNYYDALRGYNAGPGNAKKLKNISKEYAHDILGYAYPTTKGWMRDEGEYDYFDEVFGNDVSGMMAEARNNIMADQMSVFERLKSEADAVKQQSKARTIMDIGEKIKGTPDTAALQQYNSGFAQSMNEANAQDVARRRAEAAQESSGTKDEFENILDKVLAKEFSNGGIIGFDEGTDGMTVGERLQQEQLKRLREAQARKKLFEISEEDRLTNPYNSAQQGIWALQEGIGMPDKGPEATLRKAIAAANEFGEKNLYKKTAPEPFSEEGVGPAMKASIPIPDAPDLSGILPTKSPWFQEYPKARGSWAPGIDTDGGLSFVTGKKPEPLPTYGNPMGALSTLLGLGSKAKDAMMQAGVGTSIVDAIKSGVGMAGNLGNYVAENFKPAEEEKELGAEDMMDMIQKNMGRLEGLLGGGDKQKAYEAAVSRLFEQPYRSKDDIVGEALIRAGGAMAGTVGPFFGPALQAATQAGMDSYRGGMDAVRKDNLSQLGPLAAMAEMENANKKTAFGVAGDLAVADINSRKELKLAEYKLKQAKDIADTYGQYLPEYVIKSIDAQIEKIMPPYPVEGSPEEQAMWLQEEQLKRTVLIANYAKAAAASGFSTGRVDKGMSDNVFSGRPVATE